MNSFGSLIEKPAQFSFDTQDENEVIELLLRKHKFTWLRWLLPSVIIFILSFYFPRFDLITHLGVSSEVLRATTFLLQVVIIFFILENFLLWYFSVDLVTNKRIIDTGFVFPFYKKVSQLSLTRIQDISDVTNGFFPSLLNYGDLRIETAGETSDIQITYSQKSESHPESEAAAVPTFTFKSVPKLELVQKTIMRLANIERTDNNP